MKIKILADDLSMTNACWSAWMCCITLASDMGASEIRLTSAKRMRGPTEKLSFHHAHPYSQAFDFVAEGVDIGEYHAKLIKCVGFEFDVIYHENRGSEGMHFHIEHDPRA